MNDDNDLKLTLYKVVLHAVSRIETTSDVKIRRCVFQKYKEWLGRSIDEWVLALTNEGGKSDANFY